MNTLRYHAFPRWALWGALVLLPSVTAFSQGGSLTPSTANGALDPGNNPQPNLRSLVEVEPSIPIDSLPFTITQPGTYHLVKSLATGTDGITINADDVVLDLRGFTLTGGNRSRGVLVDGALTPRKNVTVRNGVIRNFGDSVELRSASNCRVENVLCIDPVSRGLYIVSVGSGEVCEGNAVSGCAFSQSGLSGIDLRGDDGGVTDQNSITDCTVSDTGASAINLFATGTGSTCSGNTVENCSIVDFAGNAGIQLSVASLGACNGNILRSCTVLRSTVAAGIDLSGSGGECQGNLIAKNSIANVFTNGILTGAASRNHIVANTVSGVAGGNTSNGINVSGGMFNHIEANHVTGGTATIIATGIRTGSGSGNFVFRNSVAGHNPNYLVQNGDTFGPVVSTTGQLANTGDDAHPWANFER